MVLILNILILLILPLKHSLLLLKEMISLLVWIIGSESIMGGAKTLEPDLGCDPCQSYLLASNIYCYSHFSHEKTEP